MQPVWKELLQWKRAKTIYEGEGSQKTDVRGQKMGRRKKTFEDKRGNAKVTQGP